MERKCGNCAALVKQWPDGRERTGTYGCKLDSGLHYETDDACTLWVGCGIKEEEEESIREEPERKCGACHYGTTGKCFSIGSPMSFSDVGEDGSCDFWEKKNACGDPSNPICKTCPDLGKDMPNGEPICASKGFKHTCMNCGVKAGDKCYGREENRWCCNWKPMDVLIRGEVLDEAKRIINGKRQNIYGDPEDCFDTIARLWSNYGPEVTRADVAVMMALLKVARIKHGAGDRDNYRDACGYLALACDMDKADDVEKD